MAFTKAVIEVMNGKKKKEKIPVLFNPNEYSIESGNQYASATITGLAEPVAQFISGNAQTLSMELFFDTSEVLTDVREHTDKVTGLLDVDSELHAPPLCRFVWGPREKGGGNFEGLVEKVTQKFTMFSTTGVPVRATLNVTFRSCMSITDQFKKISPNSADRTKQQVLNQGEQLWEIAEKEYQDPGEWRAIAQANNIDNPRLPAYGGTIVIPRLR
jgi:hypothetical protein